ncbi:glycosyltransferase [Janibacter hoylei]|uniref:glycosyltransferase n=1 Tax=Janibacter hoylei TaxID=364298 RepID=UPI002491876C|nr:glycosyltransferase [Janibacter hoylei]
MKILHITECYASGVARAIESIVALSPDHEHYLLHAGDEQPPSSAGFASTTPLPRGLPRRVLAVREHARAVGADAVHAHSSWAGVYARVPVHGTRVIYEPHCLKFTDPDSSVTHRAFYRVAERVLGARTDTFVVLSPQEDRLARELAPRARRIMLPNAPQEGLSAEPTERTRSVVMSGRLAPQKSPWWFAEAARAAAASDPTVQFRWIGDGDADARSQLAEAGVVVTGWLERDALATELAQAGVYLHSAGYEGFPISVLDAAACSTPIVVRDIAAFEGTGLQRAVSPSEGAALSLRALDDADFADILLDQGRSLLSTMNRDAQRHALERLYG